MALGDWTGERQRHFDRMNCDRMHRMNTGCRPREVQSPGVGILFTLLSILSQFILSKCR